jgi:phosphatidylglycerophosphatase A
MPRRPALAVSITATWFGLGFSPRAPGTCGTLGAIPLAWALDRLGPTAFVLGLVAVAALGVWAAQAFGNATGRDDDQRIVIDEVAGYLLTVLPVTRGPLQLALGFVLFRIFDMWKPQPVRWLDRNLGGGIGVMVDDLGAGVYGALVLYGLEASGAIAWLARLL